MLDVQLIVITVMMVMMMLIMMVMIVMKITFAFLLLPHRLQRPRHSCPPPTIVCTNHSFENQQSPIDPIWPTQELHHIVETHQRKSLAPCTACNLYLPELGNLTCIQALPVVEVLTRQVGFYLSFANWTNFHLWVMTDGCVQCILVSERQGECFCKWKREIGWPNDNISLFGVLLLSPETKC